MMKRNESSVADKASDLWLRMSLAAAFALPGFALADTGGADPTSVDAEGKICTFFGNINNLLNIASIAVVTIAVIFAGYQIAFAHKRIADVAPILIGGLLIGAAGQISKMLIGGTDACMVMMDVAVSAARYA